MRVTYATGRNWPAHTRGVAKNRAEQATKLDKRPSWIPADEWTHGTLRLYRLTYRDPDPSSPDFTTAVWRYDLEHVLDAWLEGLDGDDWELVRIEALRSAS